MPPKKKGGAKSPKKGGKKEGEGGGKKSVLADAEQNAYRVTALESTVEGLRDRLKVVGADNEDLRRTREKVEKDTHEFVAYFQKEMEKKDDLVAELKDRVRRLKQDKEDELRDMRESYEAQLAHKENEFTTMERDLKLRLKTVDEELQVLFDFKAHKQELEAKLREQAQNLIAKDMDHQKELQNLERKFLEEKTRISKDNERNIARIKRQAREEAQKGLDADTRRIVTDNRRMGEELRFQLQTTDELHEIKTRLEEANERLQREVALLEDKEKEYARQGHKKGREVKDLMGQVKTLERSLSQVVRDFEKQRRDMHAKHKEAMDEVQLEVNGLRQLVKLKNKELKTIKRLAQTILGQRTDVEQFFLEALAQVKAEIARDREAHKRSASAEIRRQARGGSTLKFPPVRPDGAAPASARGSGRGEGGGERVDLRDLTAIDRERVLRLLFARINNVQSFAGHPDSLGGTALGGTDTRYVDVPIQMGAGGAGKGVAWADGEEPTPEEDDRVAAVRAGMEEGQGGGTAAVGGAFASMLGGSFGPGTAPGQDKRSGPLHGTTSSGAFGMGPGPKSAPPGGGGDGYESDEAGGGVGGSASGAGAAPMV